MSVPALDTSVIGTIGYYRALGCTRVELTDALPYLSKIIHYQDDGQGGAEYIDGEMLIYEAGSNDDTNDCQFVYVRIRADGWILAWLRKSDDDFSTTSGVTYVSADTIQFGTAGTFFDYPDKYNKCLIYVESSSPAGANAVGKYYSVRNCDASNDRMQVHQSVEPAFQSGYTYTTKIFHTPASLCWWSHNSGTSGIPPYQSNTLFRAIWQLWNIMRNNATVTGSPSSSELPFVPPSTNYPGEYQQIIKCFQYDADVGYTDYTTEANNATANDVPFMPAVEAVGDMFYFGHDGQFDRICFKMGQAGVGTVGIVWEYWNGSTWTSYSPTVTYGSADFKTLGNNIISAPGSTTSWVKATVNGYNAYWVRARLSSGDFTAQPLGTQVWFRIAQNYSSDEYDMWNYEYANPGHLLVCGVTASGTCYVCWAIITRFLYSNILPTKTKYFVGAKINTTGSSNNIKVNDTEVNTSGIDFKTIDLEKSPFTGIFTSVGNQIVMRLWCQVYNGTVYANGAFIIISS